ncbi:MAG TPA: hypothetical protein VEQ58_17195 [Polyangiaceae bacterium]|nr:hypothetical protein [Polyangiaceae bacterium]
MSAAACAQIAGFKDLSPKQAEDGGSASVAGGGSSSKAGSDRGAASNGGTEPAEAMAGESAGGTPPSSGGSTSAGGNVAGGTSTGGKVTAGGSATAGSPSTSGSGGTGGEEVVGGCNMEQLKNGFFDRGPTAAGWQLDPGTSTLGISEIADVILDKQDAHLLADNVAPQSGDYLAWLISPEAEQPSHITIFQEVQVPQKVSKLVLKGSIRIRSAEPDFSQSKDQIDLALESLTDDRYWSFNYWSVAKDGAPDDWQAFEYPIGDRDALNELRGKSFRFKAETQADEGSTTTFWLDSLSLVAVCP